MRAVDAAVDHIAMHLAHALHDAQSLRFYRIVADAVPIREIRRALALALELDQAEIRRSRAAYFTALVRPHLRPRA